MHKQQNRAWQRGIHAARVWKKLKRVVSAWDHRCVVLANNYKLPAWFGHIPIIAILLLSLTGIVVGGIIVAFFIAFTWCLVFIFQEVSCNTDNTREVFPQNTSQSALDDEFIMNSAINNEYDGAPYKSPNDD